MNCAYILSMLKKGILKYYIYHDQPCSVLNLLKPDWIFCHGEGRKSDIETADLDGVILVSPELNVIEMEWIGGISLADPLTSSCQGDWWRSNQLNHTLIYCQLTQLLHLVEFCSCANYHHQLEWETLTECAGSDYQHIRRATFCSAIWCATPAFTCRELLHATPLCNPCIKAFSEK